MNKKIIIYICISILATLAGFFWYFSSYIKKKTSSIPQTGNKDNSDSSLVISTLNEKVKKLIDKNLIVYVDEFSLIPSFSSNEERIIVVKVDETKNNAKTTYLKDSSGLTLISSQKEAEFRYVTSENGVVNL